MKIRKLRIKNYKLFDNLELDFTDSQGEPLNIIVLAGVNGSGKTSILRLLSKIFSSNSNEFRLEKPIPLDEFIQDPDAIYCDEIQVELETSKDIRDAIYGLLLDFRTKYTKNKSLVTGVRAINNVMEKMNKQIITFEYRTKTQDSKLSIEQNDFVAFMVPDEEKLSSHFRVLYFVADTSELSRNAEDK